MPESKDLILPIGNKNGSAISLKSLYEFQEALSITPPPKPRIEPKVEPEPPKSQEQLSPPTLAAKEEKLKLKVARVLLRGFKQRLRKLREAN